MGINTGIKETVSVKTQILMDLRYYRNIYLNEYQKHSAEMKKSLDNMEFLSGIRLGNFSIQSLFKSEMLFSEIDGIIDEIKENFTNTDDGLIKSHITDYIKEYERVLITEFEPYNRNSDRIYDLIIPIRFEFMQEMVRILEHSISEYYNPVELTN